MDSMNDIQLFNIETLKSPHATHKRLRDEAPVYFAQELGVHVVTRYALLREALRDPETYSNKFGDFLQKPQRIRFEASSPETQQEVRDIYEQMVHEPPTLLSLDRPEHTHYRSLVNELFTGSRIKSAEASVQQVIDETLDALENDTAIEFVSRMAFPIPLTIIGDRLGIPSEDREVFERGAGILADGLRLNSYEDEEFLARTLHERDLQRLLIRILEERRQDPRDDMISILATSRLSHEDRPLTHGEATSILRQFLVAGHETTASAFGWGMLALCEHPELQEGLRADPTKIRTFVEEILRMESPVQGLPRIVTKDTELGGYPLKEGDFVMLRYGAANRDERTFNDPDEILLDRSKAGIQMAFGSGVHHCIGAPLARQELNLGFASLLERMENFRLDPEKPAPEAEPSFVLRNLAHLHIRFDLRRSGNS